MGLVNVQQGKAARVYGLPEIQKRMREIMNAAVKDEAEAVITDATQVVYAALKSNAASVNMPKRAQLDIFLYTRQRGGEGKRDSVTALAGTRKAGRSHDAKGYVTWNASRQVGGFDKTSRGSKKGRGKLTMPGNKIGENLGTMWEFGTTKMRPRPWFRTAITSARSTVLQKITDGYKAIIERHGA